MRPCGMRDKIRGDVSRASDLPIVLAVIALAAAGVVVGPCVPNELHLLQVKREFRALTHPPTSVLLDEAAELGLLEGNGNHCDFFVGQLRVAPLSPQAVRAAYPSSAMVEIVAELAPTTVGTSPNERLIDKGRAHQAREGETVYVVSTFDQLPAGLDLRCH